MKRSEAKKTMEEKSYKMDLSELFKVTFNKNFGLFKSGESTCVTLPIALKWANDGLVNKTEEMEKAAKSSECTELLDDKKLKKKDKDII